MAISLKLNARGNLEARHWHPGFITNYREQLAEIYPENPPAFFAQLDDSPVFNSRQPRTQFTHELTGALTQQRPLNLVVPWCPVPDVALWLQCAFSPTGNRAGCVSLMDITPSYEAMLQAQKSAQFFRLAQDHLQDLFYVKDRDSRYLEGNRAFYQFHGANSMVPLLGKTDFDSRRLTPETQLQLFTEEQEIMSSGRAVRRREFSRTPDGEGHFYESIKSPLADDSGRTVGIVGITRDITQQVRVEEALAAAKLEAENAALAKSNFLAVMSHEIRTPMNGVIGCASLLADTDLNEVQRQLLRTIQTSGDSLLILINDILDYSKIEAGKIDLEQDSFLLTPLVEDCVDLFGKAAGEKNITLNSWVEPEVPAALIGDATRIRQVLCNLLSNAVKFTQAGEVFVQVSLVSLDPEAQLCGLLVEVRDTGMGIASEQQEKLFSAFTQADNSITRKFGGTGLGLAICRKLVEQMGGEIRLESCTGQGTSFYVSLLLRYDPAQPLLQAPMEAPTLAGLRVLILDDNDTNRMVLEKTCSQWQMLPRCFATGEAALADLARGNRYDLVLLDFCMPDVDGCFFAERMKALPAMVNVPILLLSSGSTSSRHIHHVDACLAKPVRNRLLHSTIGRLLAPGKPMEPLPGPTLACDNDQPLLIAEDNSVNQMVLGMMLRKLGYSNLTVTSNGREAVEQYRQAPSDLVFMDVQMPEMDGYQAARQIRAQSGNATRPWIIALTAGALAEDRERASAAGMNEFMAKPITLEALKAALARVPTSSFSR